ncbi:peptidoglycan DD-metalloendopeptidase family protein [Acinetobacter sp. ANC 4641]|uniref:peptidoglycan DD-metalloendopeptidase family protein n=1 Tax=Acinetobacter sp. ANC 4641 TaxID=2529847 RepID=UPI0010390411|nr:peptidoglycan DD-metalloendopeptidase family protein [Acinetobacter sp. ANC 4641]TCB07030.1 LysM peptidoglycan-binding domain-containing protein [Acinetobacter sp. ANC 4641]
MQMLQQYLVKKQEQTTWLKPLFLSVAAFSMVAFTGCASKPQVQATRYSHDTAPNYYTVRSGDTLSGIAARYGLDYIAVARLNGIAPPYTIFVHQSLKLKGSSAPHSTTSPVMAHTSSRISQQTAPKVQRRELPVPSTTTLVAAPVATRTQTQAAPVPVNNGLQWILPSNNPIIQNYNLASNVKGVRFGGQQGDPVVATAAGQVVYADNGLKEFGNLVLIRHSNGYISAYAHNSKMLVKSGQTVSAGQKIAEMGSTGTDRVMLEFQIRSDGKPIDPMQLIAKNS